MININVNELKQDSKNSTVTNIRSLILPLSAEKRELKKINVIEEVNSSLYQYCDMCVKETPHNQIKREDGLYAICKVCSYGYKVGL
jgi:hypothetical protein